MSGKSDKLKEFNDMLLDILQNGAEYEVSYLDKTDYDWKYSPYEPFDYLTMHYNEDAEYRKKEKWYVFDYDDNDYRIFKDDADCAVPCVFEGTKEECEDWIKRHSKKSWLKNYLDNCSGYECKAVASETVVKDFCKELLKNAKNKYGKDSAFYLMVKDEMQELGCEEL